MIQNLNELLHFISGRVFSMAETISWRKGISWGNFVSMKDWCFQYSEHPAVGNECAYKRLFPTKELGFDVDSIPYNRWHIGMSEELVVWEVHYFIKKLKRRVAIAVVLSMDLDILILPDRKLVWRWQDDLYHSCSARKFGWTWKQAKQQQKKPKIHCQDT